LKPKQLEAWKKSRAKGMLHFVLVSGVLLYGLPMFVVMTLMVHRTELSPQNIGTSAVIWGLAGALFGIAMWYVQEWQFRKASGGGAA
jgi:nitrate/nitrite transporter NarK